MATPGNTGRTQLNAQLIEGAKGLAAPAADLLSGANLLQAAAGAIKGAALDKLLGPTAVFAGGLLGVLTVIRRIVRESQILEKGLANIAKTQQIQGKFETLLKSAELAKRRIQELYQFTANSPFRFDDVAEANRILQALTKGAYSNAAAMNVVGDTAAATGRSMSETAEKVGKLYSALASGRSIDKIAFQLQFTGLATEGLIGKLEELEKTGAGFAEQWNEVTKVLGVNQGGMQNEIKTLDALQTKLEEASALLTKAFAEPFTDSRARSIEVMTKATANLTPVLKAVGSDLAIVSGAVTDFKAGLVESTFASTGMATALRGAWEVGKGLFVTLTALTAIRAALGSSRAINFFGTAVGTAKSSLDVARASPAAVAAKAAGAAATDALTSGNLRLAASEGLVAAQFAVSSRAAAVKAAAMQAAAGSTGLAAVSNGALAASSAMAAGAASLLARVAVSVGAAIKGAFAAALANPLGIALTAIYALVTGYGALGRASKQAADGLKSVQSATSDLNRELKRTEDAFRTTDDWAAYMVKITEEIAKAEKAAADFKRTLGERGFVDRALDFISGAGSDQSRTQSALDANAADLRRQRADSFRFLPTLGFGEKEAEAFARDLRNAREESETALSNRLSISDERASLRLMDEEIAKLERMTTATLAVRDAQEKFNRSRERIETDSALQLAVKSREAAEVALREGGVVLESGQTLAGRRKELADEEKRLAATLPSLTNPSSAATADANAGRYSAIQDKLGPIREQIKLLDATIAATNEVTATENRLADMRRASGSELIRNNQRLADLRKEASTSEEARKEIQSIEQRNLALLESVKILDEERRRMQQLKFERTQRADSLALAETALSFDTRINAATLRGDTPEAERLDYLKQIAVIERQIVQARDNTLRAQQLRAERDALVAQRTEQQRRFREDATLERERNQNLVNRRPQDAKAVDDFKTLRDLTREYLRNGLSAEQARKDFNLSVKARFDESAGPRVSVDALQAVGGGGGSSAGALEYQRRTVALTEAMERHLANLVARSARGEATID